MKSLEDLVFHRSEFLFMQILYIKTRASLQSADPLTCQKGLSSKARQIGILLAAASLNPRSESILEIQDLNPRSKDILETCNCTAKHGCGSPLGAPG